MAGFDITTIDPNFIYIALLAGLWIGVTALYVPGTWIPEVGAIVLLVGSIIAMASMPTNWLAVMAIVFGVAMFLIFPFFGKKWARFAELGLAFQALGGIFLIEGQVINPLLIIFTVVLGFAYNRFMLMPMIDRQRARTAYDEANEVLGVRGRVVKDLNPVGTIYVNKELWRARSDEHLTKDTAVMVIAQDGLELIVEKTKNEDAPAYRSSQN